MDIPTTIPVPDWLHDLIAEVSALRAEIHGWPVDHEQTIRMALDTGLRYERDTLKFIRERCGTSTESEPSLPALLCNQAE